MSPSVSGHLDKSTHPFPEESAAVPSTPAHHDRVDDQPIADLSRAPLPSASTLRRRRSLPVQALRFVAFNGRILRMVVRGHRASH
jgi:hypothetical protein